MAEVAEKAKRFRNNKKKGFNNRNKNGNKKESKSQIEQREIAALREKYKEINVKNIETFKDFPLSENLLKGLKEKDYIVPTDIQRQSIGLALQGEDILGAAKTGSGKTLAFLIPVIEGLYQSQWSHKDGMGALIITSSRDLSHQISNVLNEIGKYHRQFSSGLVIGGDQTTFTHQKHDIRRHGVPNIVIGTPGRIVEHLEKTNAFIVDTVKYLVLDEADRCLEKCFARELDTIIESLPKERQNLLFSATQTKSVRDLGERVGMDSPVYVSAHEHAKVATPDTMINIYTICDVQYKLQMLWSFLQACRNMKIIVFLATCKQVRFVHQFFEKTDNSMSYLGMRGNMKQKQRTQMYNIFSRKEHCVLFCTDGFARGLDFPKVDYVIHYDCPESTDDYMHRAGRTARGTNVGTSFLLLTPTEAPGMLEHLQRAKVPMIERKPKQHYMHDINHKVRTHVSRKPENKLFAEGAFKAYLRAMHMATDKKKSNGIFDVTKIDLDALAISYGLSTTPRVRFLERRKNNTKVTSKSMKEGLKKGLKKAPKEQDSVDSDDSSDDDDYEIDSGKNDGATAAADGVSDLLQKINQATNASAAASSDDDDSDDDDSDSSDSDSSDSSDSDSDVSDSNSDDSDSDSDDSDTDDDDDDDVKESKQQKSLSSSDNVKNDNDTKKLQKLAAASSPKINDDSTDSSDSDDSDSDSDSESDSKKAKASANKKMMFAGGDDDESSEEEEDLFNLFRDYQESQLPKISEEKPGELVEGGRKKSQVVSKASLVNKGLRKKETFNKKVTFDETGKPIHDNEESGVTSANDREERIKRMEEDKRDKQKYAEMKRTAHREKKQKEKEAKRKERELAKLQAKQEEGEDGEDIYEVTLGGAGSGDEEEEEEEGDNSEEEMDQEPEGNNRFGADSDSDSADQLGTPSGSSKRFRDESDSESEEISAPPPKKSKKDKSKKIKDNKENTESVEKKNKNKENKKSKKSAVDAGENVADAEAMVLSMLGL